VKGRHPISYFIFTTLKTGPAQIKAISVFTLVHSSFIPYTHIVEMDASFISVNFTAQINDKVYHQFTEQTIEQITLYK
jgi:hypothetical protein